MNFDGRQISSASLDGPYFVRDLLITYLPSPETYLTIPDLHTTQAYHAADFDRLYALYLPLVVKH